MTIRVSGGLGNIGPIICVVLKSEVDIGLFDIVSNTAKNRVDIQNSKPGEHIAAVYRQMIANSESAS